MPAMKGPRKIRQYSEAFKLKAVLLSLDPSIQTKDVAASLDIHPLCSPAGRRNSERGSSWRRPKWSWMMAPPPSSSG